MSTECVACVLEYFVSEITVLISINKNEIIFEMSKINFLLIGRRVLPAYNPMIHLSHLVSHFYKSKLFALYSAVRRKCLLLEGMAYLVPLLHLVAGTSIRGRVRQEKGILGSMAGDFLTVLFCPFCAIVQEAQELRGDPLIGMARE